MVILQGVFRIDPQDRDAYLEQSREQMEISRSEKGCLEYALSADPLEPDRVILSERWESTADLNAHMEALTSRREAAAAAGNAPPLAPSSREVTLFEIASSKTLG